MKHQTLGRWVISTFVGSILDQYFICPRVFWVKSLQKTCLYVHEKLQRNPSVKSGFIFFIFQPYGFDYLGFLTNARRVKNSVGLLQGPRLMAWTTKSPIPGNHWVPLGCRALLGSVKPRQLMLSDRICCQTINVVRQWMLSDSRYGLTIGQNQLWNFRH